MREKAVQQPAFGFFLYQSPMLRCLYSGILYPFISPWQYWCWKLSHTSVYIRNSESRNFCNIGGRITTPWSHIYLFSSIFVFSYFSTKKGSNLLKMYMFRLVNLRVLGFQLMSSVEKSGQFECIAKIGLQASVRVSAEIISMRKTLIVVVHKCELKAVQCHNDLRVFQHTCKRYCLK